MEFASDLLILFRVLSTDSVWIQLTSEEWPRSGRACKYSLAFGAHHFDTAHNDKLSSDRWILFVLFAFGDRYLDAFLLLEDGSEMVVLVCFCLPFGAQFTSGIRFRR